MIYFHEERNLVRVLAGDRAEHAKSRSDGVAAAFDGELDDVFAVEVVGILGEAGAGGVLDALVHGQNREITGAGQAALVEHAMQIGEDTRVAVGRAEDAVDEIRAGQVEALFRDFRRTETE